MSGFAHRKVAYTVEEVADLTSISRAQIYRLIESEELPSVKVGKCRRVTAAQLDSFVRRLEESTGFSTEQRGGPPARPGRSGIAP